jgi:hypothetical protein
MTINPFDPYDPRFTKSPPVGSPQAALGIFPQIPQYDANGNPTGYRPASSGAPGGVGGKGGGTAAQPTTQSASSGTAGGKAGGTAGGGSAGGGGAAGGWGSRIPQWAWTAGGALTGGLGGQGQGPQTTTSNQSGSSSPWGPALGPLLEILGGAQNLYQNQQPQNPYAGGGGARGPSGQSQQVAQNVYDMAFGSSPFLGPAGEAFGGLLGADPQNPFREQALATGGFESNEFLAPFIQQVLGMAGGQGGGYYQGLANAGVGGGGGGGFEGMADPYLRATLEGDWLGGNPYMDDVVAAIQRDSQRSFEQSQLPLLQSQFASGGAWDSGMRQAVQQQAIGENERDIMDQISRARMGDYQFERGLMDSALGMTVQRDIAGQQASATRSAAGSAANSANARAAAELDLQRQLGLLGLGMQGMDLLSGDRRFAGELGLGYSNALDQYNLGTLGARTNLLSLVPGLEEARYTGPMAAAGLFGDLDQRSNAAAASNASRRSQAINWQNQMPWEMLGNYFNVAMPMATAFGPQSSTGQTTVPGEEQNLWGDIIAGAVSGYLGGRGAGAGAGSGGSAGGGKGGG